jgi:putative nucleotidyltransferase with HDIG domain
MIPVPAPAPPDFHVDWDALDARFDWVRAMRGTVQDPIHHAEGDVWIHTRMVCEAMCALAAFRTLGERERRIAFLGALLHDVGKPTRTQIGDDGRVTSKGHSAHGALLARRILWRLGVPFDEREEVVALVRHHQEPFWLIEREDPLRLVAASSQRVRCDLLALLAEADARGRTCEDQAKILDAIALYRAYAEEQGCLATPYAFPSAHAR